MVSRSQLGGYAANTHDTDLRKKIFENLAIHAEIPARFLGRFAITKVEALARSRRSNGRLRSVLTGSLTLPTFLTQHSFFHA
jgi:hypothetical protein